MRKAIFAGLALAAVGGMYMLWPTGARAATTMVQRDREQARSVTGQVQERGGAPVADAVVYLKNTKTLAVKTFIADGSGNFRFHALSPNVDYEMWAEQGGRRSDTKTVSSFDSRSEITVNLQLK